MDEVIPQQGAVKRSSSSLLPALRNNNAEARRGEGWPITFRHLGKAGYELTLYANTQVGRQKWLEHIDGAQQKLRARADFLNTTVISAGFFTAINKVNCVAPFGKSMSVAERNMRANNCRWWPQIDIWDR
jgi:RHO1 GDP-GTP exchange protein 1/2